MITEKDIQTRTAEILANAGFNVVASEVDEGFLKPAVFVSAYPSDVQPQCCGGALEELTVSVELKYISSLETVEDCIGAYSRIKELFLYPTFDIMDRHLTIHEMNFEIEKGAMYVYFDINFREDTNYRIFHFIKGDIRKNIAMKLSEQIELMNDK